MRLTNGLLQEYLEAELMIKKLEAQKATIRQAILEREESEFKMGDFIITKKEIKRTLPIKVEEIRVILGDRAESILKESVSTRVDVKRVA